MEDRAVFVRALIMTIIYLGCVHVGDYVVVNQLDPQIEALLNTNTSKRSH